MANLLKKNAGTASAYRWAFYVLVAIAYYILVSQYIRNIDDFGYAFVITGTDMRPPVLSPADAVRSQCFAYFDDNGRFLLHVVIQCLAALPTVVPFFLLSTVAFVLLIEGVCRLAASGRALSTTERLTALFFLLLFNAHPGSTWFNNIAFTVNYLWPGTAVVWFVLLLRRAMRHHRPPSPVAGTLLFLFALICGSLQESFTLGVAAGLLVAVPGPVRRTTPSVRLLAVGFLVGAAILFFAPANFSRVRETNSGFVPLLSAVKYYGFWLSAIGLPLLVWANRRFCPDTLRDNGLFYVAAAFNLLFTLLIACNGARQHCATTLYLTIPALQLLFRLCASRIARHRRAVAAVLLAVMLPAYAAVYAVRAQLVRADRELWGRFMATTDTLVPATGYYDLQRRMLRESCLNRFTDIDYLYIHYYKLRVMNLYATRGKSWTLRHAVLPDEADSIVALCRDIPFDRPGIYRSDRHDYFVVATRGLAREAEVDVVQSPRNPIYREALRRIRPHKMVERQRLGDTDVWFTRGDTTYYVFCNLNAEKDIHDIRLPDEP